jgi:elongation factor P
MLTTADFKKGLRILIEGEPFLVMDYTVQTPSARGSATLVKAKVRNILTNAVFDKTFRSGDKFDEPDIEVRPVQFLYASGDELTFMDNASYDQFTMDRAALGDGADYLVEGVTPRSVLFNGKVIGIEMPQFVEIAIAEVEPAGKSDMASGSATKAAKLVSGATIRVPLYLKEGEVVEVEVATGRFVRRAK